MVKGFAPYSLKLNELELSELKYDYLIPDDNETLQKDLDFIKKYRVELCRIILNLAKYDKLKNSKESPYILAEVQRNNFEDIQNLATQIHDFMNSANAENIMNRLVFIDNISEEIDGISKQASESLGLVEKRELKKEVESLSSFLQIVAMDCLTDGDKLERLTNELSETIARDMVREHRAKFLSYIDLDNVCIEDVFYVLGYSLREKNHADKLYDEFYNKNCEACDKDDCMLSYCDNLSKRNDIEADINLNEMIYNLCVDKINRKDISEDKIAYIKRKLDGVDKSTSRIICDVLKHPEKSNNKKQEKKVPLILGTHDSIKVIPTKVYTSLKDRMSLDKGFDIKVVNDIAIRNILTNYDFSDVKGGKFYKEYEIFAKEVESFRMELDLSNVGPGINIERLIKEFDKRKEVLEQNKGDN